MKDNEIETVLSLALEALEKCSTQLARLGYSANHADQAIPSLRQAILESSDEALRAAAEQHKQAQKANERSEVEPVAWYHAEDYKTHFTSIPSQDMIENGYWQPLYTSPPQRHPLTDERILEILGIHLNEDDDIEDWRSEINEARAIEAAHGITSKD
jgi:hypothetical protein